MRLIDADALKSALEIEQYNDYDDLLRTERIIDNAPTIERPHGKVELREIENSDLPERFTVTDCSCLNCKNQHTTHCEPQNKKIYGYCGNWKRR